MSPTIKVAVIGAGLAGLTTAIALQKHIQPLAQLELKVYDKPLEADPNYKDETHVQRRRRNLGAGIGLQSNGLRALEHLDPALRDKVYKSGFPCTCFKWLTASGWLLGREMVDVLPISRPLLVEELEEYLANLTREDGTTCGASIHYREVKEVVLGGKQPKLVLDNDEEEVVDMIIGADGVRSVVRQAIFGDDEKYKPEYSGLCAVGGTMTIPIPDHLRKDPSMMFYMGTGGTFGYTGLTSQDAKQLLYWSVYQTKLPPRDMKFNHELLTRQMRERHEGWSESDPFIGLCLKEAAIDNIYPVFIMPRLPTWGTNGAVLVGDAAHALHPRSGQGGSQALEDGEALALLLKAYLAQTGSVAEAVDQTVESLYALRSGRVESIRKKAMMWKEPRMPMSRWALWALYAALWSLLKVRWAMYQLGLDKPDDGWDARDEVERFVRRSS